MRDTVVAAPTWAAGLDSVQLRAVEHDGPTLLIVAGAGTGKTRTLVARLARLIDCGAAPDRLLLVTFSRRAADEMVRRLGHLIGPAAARCVNAGTFHSVAHRLLQRHSNAIGLEDGFSIIDQGDAVDLMQLARSDAGNEAEERRRRFPRKDTLLGVYSRVVNSRAPLGDVLRRSFPWVQEHEAAISSVFDSYTTHKRNRHLLDFDDLLLYWRAAAADARLGPVLAESYDHVLVDEYQDTNLLQGDIVRSLRSGGRPLTVVGDDSQAIYAFRGATVRNMLDFPVEFPEAEIITLERNYRSTQPILDLANSVLADASESFPKRLRSAEPGGCRPVLATCPDEAAQAEAVADVILEHHEAGVQLRQQAVLFRSVHHSDLLEIELRRRGIPFVKYGGLRFLESAHIRDLLAALRILDNPRDELAWCRVLQMAEGIGPAAARKAMTKLRVTETDADPLRHFVEEAATLPARAEASMEPLRSALADCRGDRLPPQVQIERLRTGLEPLLRRRYDDAELRVRDLDALARIAGAYENRARMVAELTLDPPSSTGDFAGPPLLDDDYVILSTVHSAKGGEWRVVHLIHAAEGMFPSDMATGDRAGVEEERRLFYVALTRAREHLHIYSPLRYHHGGSFGRHDPHSYAQRTRFLPPSTDALLQHRPVRASRSDTALPLPAVALPLAVDEALRGLW